MSYILIQREYCVRVWIAVEGSVGSRLSFGYKLRYTNWGKKGKNN